MLCARTSDDNKCHVVEKTTILFLQTIGDDFILLTLTFKVTLKTTKSSIFSISLRIKKIKYTEDRQTLIELR